MSGIRTNTLALSNDQFGLDGWTSSGDVWTYVSATTFTIVGDVTAKYTVGDKLKLTQTTVKYFYIIGLAFSTGLTTVTVTGGTDYTLANAAITLPFYSKRVNPASFPDWFNYSPTITGFSVSPTSGVYRFKIEGRKITVAIRQPNNGTSNLATFTITAPVTAATVSNHSWNGSALVVNNGTTASGLFDIDSAISTFTVYIGISTNTWTTSGGKRLASGTIIYEI